MDAGFFDVLHDAADDDDLAVGDCVDVEFGGVVEEFVDEDGVLAGCFDGAGDAGLEGVFVVDDFHGAAAEDEGRADEQRVAEAFGDFQCLFAGHGGAAEGLAEVEALDEGVETFAVFGVVDAVGAGADDVDAGAVEGGGEFEGVWPPNWTMTPSGFSTSTMFMTSSKVSGSK